MPADTTFESAADGSDGFIDLADYVEALRRSWRVVVAGGLTGLMVALAYSATQPTTYEATAKILYRDPGRELAVIADVAGISAALPQVLPAAQADALDGLPVAEEAAEMLGGGLDPVELLEAVSTDVAVDSNLLLVTASGEDPERVAQIANTIAEVGNQRTQTSAIEALRTLEAVLVGELKEARRRRRQIEIVSSQGALTRVRSIIDLTRPAETVSPALVPGEPSSPRTKRNGAFGLALGTILAGLLVVATRLVDRRLFGREDAARASGSRVLGPTLNLGGATGRGGLETLRQDPTVDGLRSINALMAPEARSSPEVLLVSSPRPDSDAAAVALGIALAATDSRVQTLLIDASRSGGVASRFGLPGGGSLERWLLDPGGPLADSVVRLGIDGGSPDCLLAAGGGQTGAVTAPLQRTELAELIARASDYDRVIVLAPGALERAEPLDFAPLANTALLCLGLRSTDGRDANEAALDLRQAGVTALFSVLTS